MSTPLPFPDEDEQRRGLRQMKTGATALLVLTAAVYLAAERWRASGAPPWVGYLSAAAEAGTVGGLADWFAVTALFRHPLGLPIPHTAILPTRKDALGRSLEHFVATNFLAEDVVRDKLRRLGLAGRVGEWLATPVNAARATAELATALRAAVTVLRDEDVSRLLEQVVLRHLADVPLGPPAGRLLAAYVDERAHVPLVDLVVDRGARWLEDNREAVLRLVADQAPEWSPRFLDERVAGRVYRELTRFLAEVRSDPDHRLRFALDAWLTRLSEDLQHDPATMQRAERFKARLLASPEAGRAAGALWATTKRVVLAAAEDPSSDLQSRGAAGLAALGRRLSTDEVLRAKADTWAEGALTYVVTTFRDDLTAVIGETVSRWDAAETSRKVELQVGRDLQFIRVNGTVVGALAGLVIHAVATAVT